VAVVCPTAAGEEVVLVASDEDDVEVEIGDVLELTLFDCCCCDCWGDEAEAGEDSTETLLLLLPAIVPSAS